VSVAPTGTSDLLPSPLALLREDFDAYRAKTPNPPSSTVDLALRVVTLPKLQAVTLFRLAQWLRPRSTVVATLVKSLNTALTGADLATEASVAGGLQLLHPSGVVIGPHVTIGRRCTILAGVVLGDGLGAKSPVVGDDVWLGTHAVIAGGLRVGDEASIGAHALVTTDVPDGGRARGFKAVIS
jgi:serine O-acetyltransferase